MKTLNLLNRTGLKFLKLEFPTGVCGVIIQSYDRLEFVSALYISVIGKFSSDSCEGEIMS